MWGKNQGTGFPWHSWDIAQCTDLTNRYVSQYLSTCLPWLGTSWRRDCYHLCISNTEWLVVLPYQKHHEEGSCRGSFQKSLPFCPMKLWIPDTEVKFPKVPISCMHAKSLQLCPALCNPMDCSPLGSSVHGVAKSQTWLSGFTFTFHFYTLEKEMTTQSSVLSWRIPGVGSHRVGHD